MAPALDYAHKFGIVHRDVKPANVFFDDENRAYLADFGIARMADATRTITLQGTPAYMSPEQAEGETEPDGRSDIYSLGVMLFEMLTGRQPYVAKTPTKQIIMHILQPVPNVLEANPELPQQTRAVIDKVMAKNRRGALPDGRSAGGCGTAVADGVLWTGSRTSGPAGSAVRFRNRSARGRIAASTRGDPGRSRC